MRLKDALNGILTEQERRLLVSSFDIVGDIAIIIIPPELIDKQHHIAQAIFAIHKNVKTVAKRVGNYEGEFRTIALEVIGGEGVRETQHRENGVRFFLNPAKVYYSVRSSNERKRIAGLVEKGERVLVMFSGIGVYPLVIAAHSGAGEIVGIEKNPAAHFFALKSLGANKRIKNVIFHLGDVEELLPLLNRSFDRILMPLPSTAECYLDSALSVLRPGGVLHFYDFQTMEDRFQSVEKLQRAVAVKGRLVEKSQIVVCGHVSPRTYRICVDAVIQ